MGCAPGEHFHSVIATPTFAVVNAVPFKNGASCTSRAVAVIAVFAKAPLLALTVMTPAGETEPDITYLVGENVHTVDKSNAVLWVDCTASVTAVRQDDAAKTTSDTLARTV